MSPGSLELTRCLGLPLAHGLAYIRAGILHRDISPGNILITEDGHACLIDWEYARLREDVVKPGRAVRIFSPRVLQRTAG
jgi:serine/threonine protein kinase